MEKQEVLQEVVEQIRECVKIDSSLGKYTSNTPFGQGATQCLNNFLALARSLGFETRNYDNYAGEVLFGSGSESFAVLCHLDVVPAGSGWTKDPFGGELVDGKIYGRGAMDDKGPAICCLYALKALKDEGFVPSKRIKLIVGCNEENGWKCLEHYQEFEQLPETGFSPDADFPVIYAEKGILQLRLHFPAGGRNPFFFLEGGSQANMVCDHCEANPRSVAVKRAKTLGLIPSKKKVVAEGKSAHASTPELGENAIIPILKYFEGKSEVLQRIQECVFDDIYGLKQLHDETGYLTMSPNVIKYRKGQIAVTVDIRYPATMKAEDVFAYVEKFGVKYEIVHAQEPLYVGKDSPLVQTLLGVYEECTGEIAQPVAIGGGTYARALKNGVAFGPEIHGEPSTIHQADEFISVERVELLLKAYKLAIRRCTE